jgi:prepilin-type N-terminal cleavage/methylation domain-containing protein/prepilin-type processing-associated H-X9-DG protein
MNLIMDQPQNPADWKGDGNVAGSRCALCRAFTLIELLVVISLIGALIAILLPALRSARETARGSTCAQQLKQVGLAVELYRNDFKDFFPPIVVELTPGDPNTAIRWGVQLRQYTNDRSTGNTVSTRGILHCPVVPEPNRHSSATYVSYGYNRWGVGGDKAQPGTGFAKVKRELKSPPSSTLMMIDIERTSDPVRRGWFEAYPSTFFYYTRHNDAANTLYADSHVKALDLTQILTDTSVSTNKAPWYGNNAN